ncbi:MAG TPA: glutaminyl-peptide cyclotransferase [Chryseolinea sp.]|nr:glutaminyl-peptide cyclotransferase [Chryseolinea sp.]
MKIRLLPAVLLALVALGCGEKKATEATTAVDPLNISFTVISTLPHETDAFTEGLTIHNNKVLESTGQNGKSWVAEVDPGTGTHIKKIVLDNRYFGEGMTVLNHKLYYLTWQTKIGFVYDARTYKQVGEFTYENEGWGLTHDNKDLIMSAGTDKLYFLDTTNFKIVRTLSVKDGNTSIKNLNELEYVNGYIFANVYETSTIIKIDPSNGKVVGRLDLSAQVDEIRRTFPNTNELNGIAFDKNSNALLVTGKNWPRSYLIRLQ